jgi:hypothetical protein
MGELITTLRCTAQAPDTTRRQECHINAAIAQISASR